MSFFIDMCKNHTEQATGCDGSEAWACINNRVADHELIKSMTFSSILGVCCLFLFGILQSQFAPYSIRQRANHKVTPVYLVSLRKWLYATIMTSDQHLLATSGVDGMILVKTMGFGVQLFVPLTLVAVCILLPIHKKGTNLEDPSNSDVPPGKFMQMTISNIKPGADIYWVHFSCVYAFIGYAMLLLYFQHKRFMKLRHHYLTSGDDPNIWREKFQASFLHKKKPGASSSAAQPPSGEEAEPVNVATKVTRMVKVMTGLGSNEELESALVSTPQGFMSAAATRAMDQHNQLLETLERRHSEKTSLGLRYSLDADNAATSSGIELPTIATDTSIQGVEESNSHPPAEFQPALPKSLAALVRGFANSVDAPPVHKWWDVDYEGPESSLDATNTLDAEAQPVGPPECKLISRPSIRNLRTVNAFHTFTGEQVAVHAQQYCVLITDVPDVQKMVMRRIAKKRRKKQGLAKVWDFLYRWVGGGFSMKNYHPSAKPGAAPQKTVATTLEVDSLLDLTRHVVDPLLSKPQKKAGPGTTGSKWGKVADKVSTEEIFHLEEALVEESFKALFQTDFLRAVPIRNHREVDDLLFKWDRYAWKLESAEEYLERTGYRRQARKWDLRSYCNGGVLMQSVDVITDCKFHIARLEVEIAQAQKRVLRGKPSSSWFLIFRSQHSATVAAQALLHSEASHKFKAYPAPGPEEINWQSLWKTWVEKDIRSVLVFPILVFLCLLPIGAIMGAMSRINSFLCTDSSTGWYWESYCGKHGDKESKLRILVTGWLPPILVSIWQNVIMPKSLYYLAQVRSTCISLSQLDREIASLFFYWDVFNIFIGAMMGGTLFSLDLVCRVQNSNDILHILGSAVPASANFFVNYITLRAFFLVPYQFLAPHPGIWRYLFRLGGTLGCARTKRDKTMLYRPASIRFGIEYGILLLVFLISICYSVVAPIIVPITLLFFTVSWLTWRYQVLYVFVRKYESGGRMWPIVFNRLLYCLFLFQFFTSCVLLMKQAYTQAVILFVTVPILILRFNSYCKDRFRAGMDFVPLEMAFHSPPADVDPIVYTPPALVPGCPGWHPEYMSAWEGWNAPGYVI